MTSSNGNIFRATGPLCGEFTGPGEFPTQRPVTRSFDVFFDLRLNKRLSKQPRGWWFETPSWSLWRHCNVKMSSAKWWPFCSTFNKLKAHSNYRLGHFSLAESHFCTVAQTIIWNIYVYLCLYVYICRCIVDIWSHRLYHQEPLLFFPSNHVALHHLSIWYNHGVCVPNICWWMRKQMKIRTPNIARHVRLYISIVTSA